MQTAASEGGGWGGRLCVLIGLTGAMFGAEIVACHVTQSLALLVAAHHSLYNLLSLVLLLVACRLRSGVTPRNTFGWAGRVQVLGQLAGTLLLGALLFAGCVEAVQTCVHAQHEDTQPRRPALLLLLAALHFALCALATALVGGYTHNQGCSLIVEDSDVQMSCVVAESPSKAKSGERAKGSTRWSVGHRLVDAFRDVSSCLAVGACAGIVLLMDGLILKYADAILAVAAAIVLIATTYPFLRESGLILLQSIPSHIDVDGLTKRLTTRFPEVWGVHDLHVWRLTSACVIATLHVRVRRPGLYAAIEADLQTFFCREGIQSVTIQPEFADDSGSEVPPSECILQCSVNNNCGAYTCCGPIHEKPTQPRLRPAAAATAKSEHTAPHCATTNSPKGTLDFENVANSKETIV